MKKSALILAVLLGAASAGAEASPTGTEPAVQRSAEVLDMVLASVDGEPLTMSDLKRYIAAHGDAVPSDLLDGSQEVRKHLKEMIIDQLVSKEAETSGISVTEDEVEAYIQEIRRQNGVDAEGFAELLRSRNISVADYKMQVRSDILRTRIMGVKIRPKVNVLEDEVRAYLEEHPDLQPKTGEIRVEQVLLKFPEGADDAAMTAVKERAEEVRVAAADGKELSSLAKDDYTDLGFVSPDDLRPVLAEAVKDLGASQVAMTEEAGTGIYILKVGGDREESEIDEGVRQTIRRELFENKMKAAVEKFFNDDLPKKYHVELKL
jgi:parvulin-like peptidyl-prolyl isomerase